MVTHVALQKLPFNLTELRAPSGTATGVGSDETGAPRLPEQVRAPAADLPPVDAKMLAKAVKDLSAGAQNLQRSLQFSIDASSGRTVIKVIDKITQEVIRQIPEEEVLALAARLEKSTGRLVQDEA